MSPEDKRLVAALGILRKQIDPIIEELLAGQLDRDERQALALVLCTIAADLDPEIRAAASPRNFLGSQEVAGHVQGGAQLRPAGSRPLPFSTSGP